MSDPFGYNGKRVIVAGCFSGIGHATARLLLDAGAEVHGLDVKKPDLALASFSAMDLRDPSEIDNAVDKIGGSVRALFNCAGLAPMNPTLDVMRVNFIGMRHLSYRIMDLMPPGAAIVCVGSNGGANWRQHLPDLLALVGTDSFEQAVRWCKERADVLPQAYRFSKESIAVWAMRESANCIRRGIRLNCTSPGTVQTPMLDEIEKVTPSAAIDAVSMPIGRRSSADEQAWPLLMLNSDLASYINGVDLAVDGGFIATQMLKSTLDLQSSRSALHK